MRRKKIGRYPLILIAEERSIDLKIILLPGLDGTGILFKPFIDALPSTIETLVISYPPDEKLSYKGLTEYVMDRLPKDEAYVLLGESFSGPIAYEIALSQPGNMKAVVFVASFLKTPQRLVLGLSRLLPRSLLLSLPMPEFVIKLFLLGPKASTQLVDLFRVSLNKVSAKVLSYRLNEITNLSINKQKCDVRAVYIQADDDYLVPERCVETFKEVMDNLKIYQVTGPHLILQANPLASSEIIVNEIRKEWGLM